jgi:hypothetical protein
LTVEGLRTVKVYGELPRVRTHGAYCLEESDMVEKSSQAASFPDGALGVGARVLSGTIFPGKADSGEKEGRKIE